MNETVIKRVIQPDLRIGDRGRKRDEALLEEIFRLACRYAGQSPSPQTFMRLQEQIPLIPTELRLRPELTTVAGHLAESVVGASLASISGLDVAHVPERGGDPEVDFVLTLGTHRIPIEVKYQARIDPLRDTEGVRTFLEKTANNAPFGLLITQSDDVHLLTLASFRSRWPVSCCFAKHDPTKLSGAKTQGKGPRISGARWFHR